MNKSQLIDALAARFDGNKKAAAHALESVLDTITREVARGEKVAITGFGSFEKRLRPARMVRNPQTGEQIKTKKTFVPKFSAGADLKNVVSGVKKLPKLTLPSLGKQAPATKAAPAKVAAGPATSTKEPLPPARPRRSSRLRRRNDDEGCSGEGCGDQEGCSGEGRGDQEGCSGEGRGDEEGCPGQDDDEEGRQEG